MIDIDISFTPDPPDTTSIFPGEQRTQQLQFELTNRNEPDMNFDTAEVEVPRQGANFEFTVRVVDVNLTQTDDVTHEVNIVQELVEGNVSTALNSSGIMFYTMRFDVRALTVLVHYNYFFHARQTVHKFVAFGLFLFIITIYFTVGTRILIF